MDFSVLNILNDIDNKDHEDKNLKSVDINVFKDKVNILRESKSLLKIIHLMSVA